MSNMIKKSVALGQNLSLADHIIIEDDVVIGNYCTIGYNVIIHEGTRIGNHVRIDDHVVIGKKPMRAGTSILREEKNLSAALIGDDCIIGTGVIIYAGATISNQVLVADLASVRERVTVGEYTIIGRGVTVENEVKIGKYCKLESECYITAYSELEDYVFVAPGVVTSNDNYLGRTEERLKLIKGVTIKRGARIGANAVILPGKVIGEDALVAAGSVVTKDVPSGKIVMGLPARYVRNIPQEQRIENQKFYKG